LSSTSRGTKSSAPGASLYTEAPGLRQILRRIDFDLRGDLAQVEASCAAAADLTLRLMARSGIPGIRLRYFNDPGFNVQGAGKSCREVFEKNGVAGVAILEHPHFLPYLRYFLFGPDLPSDVVAGFVEMVREDADRDQLHPFARASMRAPPERRPQRRRELTEEFFKLALEVSLDDWTARSVRDAARSAR
jgi:hypothetical protein